MIKNSPTISIVIPCYNEQNFVSGLLDDIAPQIDTIHQIIIADSGSTDKTIETIKAHRLGENILLAHDTYKTPGGARNAGAALATGDYIVFIDADTRIPKSYIHRLQQYLASNPVTYVTPLFTINGIHPIDHGLTLYINGLLYFGHGQNIRVPGAGMLMCVSRRAHEAINGFDNKLIKENDNEYLERLRKLDDITFSVLPFPLITSSNRRYKKQGRLVGLLYLTPRDSWIGKRFIYPMLHKAGHQKQYGIFGS